MKARIILACVLALSLTGCMGGMIRADVGGYVGPVYIQTSVEAPLNNGYYSPYYQEPPRNVRHPIPYRRR